MKWHILTNAVMLNQIDEASHHGRILIFKHSTRCNISAVAMNRIEAGWQATDSVALKPYFLDLIRYRDLSNLVAEHYGVAHESPQVLIIENGKCIYTRSHAGIRYEDLMEMA